MFSASFFLLVFSLVLTASPAPVQQQPTMKLLKSPVEPMMGAPSLLSQAGQYQVVDPNQSSVLVSSSIHPSSVESHPMNAPQYPFPLVHHGDISSDIQLSPSHLDNGIVSNGLQPSVMPGIQSDLPILVDGQAASMGASYGSSLGSGLGMSMSMGSNLPIIKEVSMADKMFPWYKKVRSAISSGSSKIKSILPGNPFKKLFGRNGEETVPEEYATHEEAPIISKDKSDILSEAKKAVVKAAEKGAAKLTQLVGETNKNLGGVTNKNFVGPSSLVASVKVKHPMIGKQSAKVKLSTV